MPSESVPWIVGALVAALGVLWRQHQKDDADVRLQRDSALAREDRLIEVSRDQVAATNRLADTIERDHPKAG